MQFSFVLIFLFNFSFAEAKSCEARLTSYNLAETLWNDFVANQEAGRGRVVSRRLYSDLYEKMGQDIRAAKDTLDFWKENKRPNSQQRMILDALTYFWANTSIRYKALSNMRFVSNEAHAALAYDVAILNSLYKPELMKKLFVILKAKPTTFGIGAYFNDIEHAFDRLLERVKDPEQSPTLIAKLVSQQPNFLLLPTYSELSIAKINAWTVFPVIPLGVVRGPDSHGEFHVPYGFFIHDIGHASQLISSFGADKPLSIAQLKIKVARRFAIRQRYLSMNDRGYETHARRLFEFTWFRGIHEIGLKLERHVIASSASNFPILRLAQPLPGEEHWYSDYFMNQLPTCSEVEDVAEKMARAVSN